MTDPATGRESHPGKAGFFLGKASYYARYRRGYPLEVFDTIISRFALTPSSEILDLGCGTGNVAIPLAARGFCVHAIDPEPEMLLEARRCEAAAHSCGISWQLGSDKSLGELALPRFRLCTMGLSFHWMDRPHALVTLDTLIEPGGGIACLSRNDSFLSHLDNRWGGAVKEVLHEMLGDAWDYSGRLKRGQQDRHEEIFLQSPFPVIEEYDFPVREELTVDDIIGLQLSTSYAAPALLTDRNAEFRKRLTRRLLDLEPSGKFTDESTVHLIIAKRR
jgi:SAM-dependent methyltransferase